MSGSEEKEIVKKNERFIRIQSEDTLMKMTDGEQVQVQ